MKKLLVPLAVLALCTAPAGALDFNEARFASVATSAMMAQLVQVPETGGIAAGDDTAFTGDNTFAGTSIFSGVATFNATISAPCVAGTGNECFGSGAGAALVAGADFNTLFGFEAGKLLDNAGADNNTFFGYQAGDAANAVAANNTFFGSLAGSAVTTGDDNTLLGYGAGFGLTTVGQNTLVGSLASDAESFARVTGIGYGLVPGGQDTILIGTQATSSNSNGVGIGGSAQVYGQGGVVVGLRAKTSDGVSLGYQAGDAQTAADVDNAFTGFEAGGAASGTSTDNTCGGDLCLAILTSGDRNAHFGANADVGTATDSDATALGESMVSKNSDSLILGFGGREGYFIQGLQKTLTESTATATVRISVASDNYTGVRIKWRVFADDGTDFQALSGESTIDCVNKATAETCVVRTLPAFGAAVEAASAGTLALDADPTLANNAEGTIDFLLDATSSLTQTTLEALYSVEVVGPATTITPL